MRRRSSITEEKVEKIISLYQSGKTQAEIAKIIPCAQTSVSNILLRNGIKTRFAGKIIYTDVNKTFFKEINTEESAYFLGFMYADGCVQINKDAYVMTFKLKSDDIYIIEKFRNIMSLSSPIRITSNGKYAKFTINQKEIITQLISHGCVPRKSLKLQFPFSVPNVLIRHFLRGYSDGDGTIYKNKLKSSVNTIWKIISTEQFCQKAGDILKNHLHINYSKYLCKPKTNKITTALHVGGNNQVEKVLDWLYKDATIYLPRKYDRYIEFKQIRSTQKYVEFKRLNFNDNQKDKIVQLYNNGMIAYDIALLFGCSKPSILKILHDKNVILRPNAIGLNIK